MSHRARHLQRGVSLLESLILLGMLLVIAGAGVRLAGRSFDALAGRQAGCVDLWSSDPACVPGGGERAGAVGGVDGAGALASRGVGSDGEASRWSTRTLLAFAGGETRLARRTAPLADTTALAAPAKSYPAEVPDGVICFEVGDGGQAVQVSGEVAGQSTSIKVGQGVVTPSADGLAMVTITVTLSAEDARTLEKDLGRYGFSIEGSHGGSITVSITVPVSGTRACLPNILDPSSWPVGTSLRVEVTDKSGYGGSVTVNGVTVGVSQSESHGVALVITRADEDHLIIAVGDTETVGSALSLGIGRGPVEVGIVSGDDWRSDDFRVAEVDLRDGSVRHGTMYTLKSGRSLTGYVQLDMGGTIRFEWTLNGEGTSLTTTRYGDVEKTVLTEWTQDGSTATYTVEDGVPGDVMAVWLVGGDQVSELLDPPPCLDHGKQYVVRWTMTPADREAFVQQVEVWWDALRTFDDAGPHMNPIAKVVPQYPGIDGEYSTETLTVVLSTSTVHHIGELQRAFADAGVEFPGTVEVLDPSTGEPVTC